MTSAATRLPATRHNARPANATLGRPGIAPKRGGEAELNIHHRAPAVPSVTCAPDTRIGGYAHPPAGSVFLRSVTSGEHSSLRRERISRMHEEAAQGAPWTQG